MKTLKAMKKFFISRTMLIHSLVLFSLFVSSPTTFASSNPSFVSGAQNLATDALTWILILVPITAALMVGYHAWMKSMADGDPGAISERNKKMRNTIISAVIAESAMGIVTLVLAYFN